LLISAKRLVFNYEAYLFHLEAQFLSERYGASELILLEIVGRNALAITKGPEPRALPFSLVRKFIWRMILVFSYNSGAGSWT